MRSKNIPETTNKIRKGNNFNVKKYRKEEILGKVENIITLKKRNTINAQSKEI